MSEAIFIHPSYVFQLSHHKLMHFREYGKAMLLDAFLMDPNNRKCKYEIPLIRFQIC